MNLDLCSLPSSLPLFASPSPVCLFVCGPNALNFYFRLSQFTQANGKKYFSFGWLPWLAWPFINRPELRIKLCTWRVCLLLLCIRYVTLRIRNVLHGLHGVIDKVKFRTFAANFCGRLLWFWFRPASYYLSISLSAVPPPPFMALVFFFRMRQRVIWASNFKALAINYVRGCRRSPFRSDCLIYPLSLG